MAKLLYTTSETRKFAVAMDDSDFHYEKYYENTYEFPEDEEYFDFLEMQLQKIFDARNISGYFERED